MPVTASSAGAGASVSTSGPPRRWGTSSSSSAASIAQPGLGERVLEPDEVAAGERLEQTPRAGVGHLEAGHQRGKQRGVAQADAVVLQAGRIERVAEHRERLGGALRRGRADQLDSRLQQLAWLAALRADAAVAVGEIAEAQRRLA